MDTMVRVLIRHTAEAEDCAAVAVQEDVLDGHAIARCQHHDGSTTWTEADDAYTALCKLMELRGYDREG